METVKSAFSMAVQRLHIAQRLQRRHQLNSQDMAGLLGMSVETYHKRLHRAGLVVVPTDTVALNIDDILLKINTELQSFSKADGLPDKSAVDALASLAKAVKSISELSKETRLERLSYESENQSENGGVKPEDVREALSLINCKIIELSGQSRQSSP